MPQVITRETRIDGLKFVLICLVILGHIGYNDYWLGINRLIYSFHMPLFVMISGFFTHRQSCRRFVQSSFKLLSLYIIFQTVHLVYDAVFDGKPFTFGGYLDPAIALWYLLCLFYWRGAYHLIKPRMMKLRYALVISFLLSIIVGYVPLGNEFLGFQRAFSFLPFFVFGLMLKNARLRNKIAQINAPVMTGLLLFSLVFARLLPCYMPSSPYEVWYEPILRLIQTLLAFIICVGIIRFLPSKLPEGICKLGQWTLYYYLYHTFMLKILAELLRRPDFELNVFGALLCVMLMVVVITLMHRVKLFRLLLLEK